MTDDPDTIREERDSWIDAWAETATERTALRHLVGQLVGYLRAIHPLPWRVESDWTFEVIDADGRVVTKLSRPDLAGALVRFAEQEEAEGLRLIAIHASMTGGVE